MRKGNNDIKNQCQQVKDLELIQENPHAEAHRFSFADGILAVCFKPFFATTLGRRGRGGKELGIRN